ncbi:MAG: hypothetical protein ACI39F_00505, partial [Acutalibacteraceae bacterium]
MKKIVSMFMVLLMSLSLFTISASAETTSNKLTVKEVVSGTNKIFVTFVSKTKYKEVWKKLYQKDTTLWEGTYKSYNKPVDNIKYTYKVYRKADGTNKWVKATGKMKKIVYLKKQYIMFEDAKVKQGIGYKYKVVALKKVGKKLKKCDTAVSKTSVKLSDLNVKVTTGTVEHKIKFNEIADVDKYNIYVRKRMFGASGGKSPWEKQNLNKDDNGTYYFFGGTWDCYQFKVVALKNGKVIDTCYSDEKKPVDYSVKDFSYKWTKDRLKALGEKCNAYAQSLGFTTELSGTYAGGQPISYYNFKTAFRRLKEKIDDIKYNNDINNLERN